MNQKIILLGVLVNVMATILLSIIYHPILFLGPIIGGFFISFFSEGYEDYDKMELRDGIVLGAISGLIGGIILGILFIMGIGDLKIIWEVIREIPEIGNNVYITGYIIFQLSVIFSFILGILGGVLGVLMKPKK